MRFLTIILLIFMTPFADQTEAENVTIATAANVQFAMAELKTAFESEHDATVDLVISSSGKLTTQIINGAPFDIFLSADMAYPDTLFGRGLAVAAPEIYARGSLVLWTLSDLTLTDTLAVLPTDAVETIAIANPELAPYGVAAVQALKYFNLFQSVDSKLVYGQNIAQVNQYVTSRAATTGLTAKSVVLAPRMRDTGHWIDVPPRSYRPIEQGIVLLKHGRDNHPQASRQFFDFMFSAKARAILQQFGYQLP